MLFVGFGELTFFLAAGAGFEAAFFAVALGVVVFFTGALALDSLVER